METERASASRPRATSLRPRRSPRTGVSRVSHSRRSSTLRRLGAGLARLASGLALGACSEVESNLRENQPYEVIGAEDAAIKTVKMEDATAALVPVRTTTVRREGNRKVVPHNAVIYNPD